jgi:HK97 gp10 family phage protein
MLKGRIDVKFNRFREIGHRMSRRGDDVVQKTGEDVRDDTKARLAAQVREHTGKLVDSWQAQRSGEHEATVFSDYFVSLFMEFGTVKMAARPAIVPAVEAARGSFVAALRRLER